MGSKGSYSGGGGAAGDSVREGIDDWLAALPGGGAVAPASSGADADNPGGEDTGENGTRGLSPQSLRVLPTAALFRTSRSGSGGRSRQRDSRGTGTSSRSGSSELIRSASTSARAAGRGAAAAYAYRTGDAQTLRELGLDYDALRANPNIFEVANQIAQKACQDLPPGTVATEELYHVVGNLAEWVADADQGQAAPPPELIAQEAIGLIIATAYLTETAATLNEKEMTSAQRQALEASVREASEELASQIDLSPDRPTASEFGRVIEQGLEYLRDIYEDRDDD
jgi:hypothetical protein